jgi:hypothetical protein
LSLKSFYVTFYIRLGVAKWAGFAPFKPAQFKSAQKRGGGGGPT